MPYIKPDSRKKFDEGIKLVVEALKSHTDGEGHVGMGDVNYVFSSIVWELFRSNISYGYGNSLVGMLECVKQEFYRRQLAVYEDQKMQENGDI